MNVRERCRSARPDPAFTWMPGKLGSRTAGQFRVAQLDLAWSGEEDTEQDRVGVLGDRCGDLVAGPVAVARDRDDVVAGVVDGGAFGDGLAGVLPADDAQEQPSAVHRVCPRVTGAELAAEGDHVAAV